MKRVLQALREVDFPRKVGLKNAEDNKKEVAVEMMCVGMVYARPHGMIVSNETLRRPNLTSLLVSLMREYDPTFKFTSIQIDRQRRSPLHCDANNHGRSLMMGLGDYVGGRLWLHGTGPLDCRERFVEFDGNVAHCTLPFKGERFSLMYYTNKLFNHAGKRRKRNICGASACTGGRACKQILRGFGFPIPTKRFATRFKYPPVYERLALAKGALAAWKSRRSI
jgi:hypothetical protein